jgi:hypothetical protein
MVRSGHLAKGGSSSSSPCHSTAIERSAFRGFSRFDVARFRFRGDAASATRAAPAWGLRALRHGHPLAPLSKAPTPSSIRPQLEISRSKNPQGLSNRRPATGTTLTLPQCARSSCRPSGCPRRAIRGELEHPIRLFCGPFIDRLLRHDELLDGLRQSFAGHWNEHAFAEPVQASVPGKEPRYAGGGIGQRARPSNSFLKSADGPRLASIRRPLSASSIAVSM